MIPIFQLYYNLEQKSELDPDFVPYENCENPSPELGEWYVWNQQYTELLYGDAEYWGFVDWQFKHKTNLTATEFANWINNNPGYDFYFVNPTLINEAVFVNPWEQGNYFRPGTSDIGNECFAQLGYNVQVENTLLDRTCAMFSNYVVGNKKFWKGYIGFTNKLLTAAESDQKFKEKLLSAATFPFIVPMLLSTYIDLEKINALNYSHTTKTLPSKYEPYISDIMALSDLKVAVNRYNSGNLYAVWDHYRHQFIKNHPSILNLE